MDMKEIEIGLFARSVREAFGTLVRSTQSSPRSLNKSAGKRVRVRSAGAARIAI